MVIVVFSVSFRNTLPFPKLLCSSGQYLYIRGSYPHETRHFVLESLEVSLKLRVSHYYPQKLLGDCYNLSSSFFFFFSIVCINSELEVKPNLSGLYIDVLISGFSLSYMWEETRCTVSEILTSILVFILWGIGYVLLL